MNGGLGDLYQEVIIDHGRQPRNFRKLDGATRLTPAKYAKSSRGYSLRSYPQVALIYVVGEIADGVRKTREAALARLPVSAKAVRVRRWRSSRNSGW